MPKDLGRKRNNPDRVIDTWVYKVKDVEYLQPEYVEGESDRNWRKKDERTQDEKYVAQKQRVTNKVVKIEVILEKDTVQSEEPPHPTSEVKFRVRCDELDLDLHGTDIEMLRQTVWDRLDKKFEIKWERFYLVEIKHQRPYHADGTGILFEYDGVERGTTWNGKHILRKFEGGHYRIKVWPGAFKDSHGDIMACIPATDQNREALEEFVRRMDRMRELMADFLRPEKILQTLADLSGAMPFLPKVLEDAKRGVEAAMGIPNEVT